MKNILKNLTIGILMFLVIGFIRDYIEPHDWLTKTIEVGEIEDFARDFGKLYESIPIKRKKEFDNAMLIILLAKIKEDNNFNIYDENITESDALASVLMVLYKVAIEEKKFSLIHVLSIREAIKKEMPEFYKEAQALLSTIKIK